jgi:hypothetical protein
LKKEKPAEKAFGFFSALGSAAYFSSPWGEGIHGPFSSPIKNKRWKRLRKEKLSSL